MCTIVEKLRRQKSISLPAKKGNTPPQGFHKTISRLQLTDIINHGPSNSLMEILLSPEGPRLLSGPGYMNWRLAMICEHLLVCDFWSFSSPPVDLMAPAAKKVQKIILVSCIHHTAHAILQSVLTHPSLIFALTLSGYRLRWRTSCSRATNVRKIWSLPGPVYFPTRSRIPKVVIQQVPSSKCFKLCRRMILKWTSFTCNCKP